jgi:AhpD family alkylhydroperoxidase
VDDRIKELVAIGASITANCGPCLEYHAAKAKEHGAGDDDIRQAVRIGQMVRKGSTAKMEEFIETFLKGGCKGADSQDSECSLS